LIAAVFWIRFSIKPGMEGVLFASVVAGLVWLYGLYRLWIKGDGYTRAEIGGRLMDRYNSTRGLCAERIVTIQAHESGDFFRLTVENAAGAQAQVEVKHTFVKKYNPKVGGFLLIYDGGTKAYLPAGDLKAGYALAV
jgi:hypothetical protein